MQQRCHEYLFTTGIVCTLITIILMIVIVTDKAKEQTLLQVVAYFMLLMSLLLVFMAIAYKWLFVEVPPPPSVLGEEDLFPSP